MFFSRLLLICGITLTVSATSIVWAQQEDDKPLVIDSSDLNRQLIERQEKINALSAEEQQRLLKAREAAFETPEVKAAIKKRNEALQRCNSTLREVILKIDPSLVPIMARLNSNPAE